MPHVIHVYKDFWPPVLGGIERCIHWMAAETVKHDGWEVTVLVNSRTRESREREVDGIRIIEVGEWGRALSAPLSPGFPLAMRKLKADIWHFHIPNPTGDVSWLLARPKGAVVATWHSDVVRQKWAMFAYAPLLRAFLRHCRVIMPTSPRLIDSSEFLRERRRRCHAVPLGMPLGGFERTPERLSRARAIRRDFKGMPLVCFVGKLRYYKGLQFLVSALRVLPGVQALIIGEGPEGEKLKRLAAELDVADRTHFLGELPDEDVVHHLLASDVFVLPSHLPSEAFGLSQVEAMACGIPVVSTDLPTGVPYVNQHGETGLIVPPGDDLALAGAIDDLLTDTTRRLRMGEAALRRAHAEFSAEVMGRRLQRVYKKVAQQRH
jgi:glycosyltransferase involved in cell wall biosynthesis